MIIYHTFSPLTYTLAWPGLAPAIIGGAIAMIILGLITTALQGPPLIIQEDAEIIDEITPLEAYSYTWGLPFFYGIPYTYPTWGYSIIL